ncbi:MAG: hypothetical protein ACYTXE_36260 [Nostoc sp.]
MEEIKAFNRRFKAERKIATFGIGILLVGGLSLTLPLWSDTTKYSETLFCFTPNSQSCKSDQIKRGISWIVEHERRNSTFDSNIKIVGNLAPESPAAPLFGLAGTAALLAAYIGSKMLTDSQESAIHSQFSLLKVKALQNDLDVDNHLDLTKFSKEQQNSITKNAIARNAAETIQQMKSDGELITDKINGEMQYETVLKSHELNLSNLDKQIVDNRLAVAKATKELNKVQNSKQDSKTATQVSPDQQLKNSLIDALKNHEDGYLWKIINSLKPLWLIGNQGSGKTYTAAAIALIRKYCLNAPIHQLIDRHATGDNADVWKLLDVASSSESEGEISLAFEDCCERWLVRIKQKPTTKQQVIVDEFTNLKSLCGESAIAFFKMSLTDTRKAKEYLLGITHNATNESFPDGTASARKSGTVLLEKFSANGETPLKRVVVRYGLVDEQGNNLDDVEKTLPDWFHPEKIYQHFNGKPLSFED